MWKTTGARRDVQAVSRPPRFIATVAVVLVWIVALFFLYRIPVGNLLSNLTSIPIFGVSAFILSVGAGFLVYRVIKRPVSVLVVLKLSLLGAAWIGLIVFLSELGQVGGMA
jgi:multisubunit Na+/H+ antiporter MnhF subunit